MSAIKITPADSAFSKCIRARARGQCELCGSVPTKGGLDCSHFHGRANWSIRFHPDNAAALCCGCHSRMGGNPHDHQKWFMERLGPGRYQMLLELKQDTGLGKLYRKTKGKGEIAAWYREQLKELEAKADHGGELDFEAFY